MKASISSGIRALAEQWSAFTSSLTRRQALIFGAWTVLLIAATALTCQASAFSLTAVILYAGLLICGLSARMKRIGTIGMGVTVDCSFLLYCLEMALLGATLTAVSAIVENVAQPYRRPILRWINTLIFGTLGLLGGLTFHALEPAGPNACSSLSSACGSYLGETCGLALGFLTLNFVLVWSIQFVPDALGARIPWRSYWGILASFALSLPLLAGILVAWAQVGALALLSVAVLAAGFMWLLHRMYTAEHLADELQEMAGHLDVERLYRVLVENLPAISVALVSPELQILAVHGGEVPAALAEEAVGSRLADLQFLTEEVRSAAAEHCLAALAGERRSFEVEHADRIFDVTFAPVHDDGTKVSGALAVVHEVTERRMFERRIAHQATHDALTGLPNRAAFMDALERASGADMTVMMIDLDKFKSVNDSFGHETGDELLRVIAQRLQSAVRADDLAARLAGDEFAVLLAPGSTRRQAHAVAQRIANAANAPVQLAELLLHPRISVGVAIAQTDAEPERLLHEADIAMYSAKASDQGHYRIYDRSLGNSPEQRHADARVA